MLSIYKCYDYFGIDETTSFEEIQKLYKKKAKLLHPDLNSEKDTTKEFQELNEYFQFLKIYYHKGNSYSSNEWINEEYEFKFSWEENIDTEKYQTNIDNLTCNCNDWIKYRSKYNLKDPRRLCKHIVAKFQVLEIDFNANIIALNIPQELKPFEKYIINQRYKKDGVKLFEEIVFLNSSIIVINSSRTHIYLYLKE